MKKNINEAFIQSLAKEFGYEVAAIKAVMEVESAGNGFAGEKILIQFEPGWFKRLINKQILQSIVVAQKAKTKTPEQEKLVKNWDIAVSNEVEGQYKEWQAFNAAFAIDPTGAMLSTSYGLSQVMGFNHKVLGYKTVNEMLDDFKTGEAAQLRGMMKFIKSNPKLHKAMKEKDWKMVAYFYNGSAYARNNYDSRLKNAYNKHNK